MFQLLNHSKLFKRNSIHLLLVKLEYNDEIQKKLMEFFGCHNFHRFKITSVGSGEKAGQPDGKKKVVAEAVIYPTEHCSADAIAHFVLDTPEIMSIERLEDL